MFNVGQTERTVIGNTYGLDGEAHPGFHRAYGLVLRVVGYVRGTVEEVVDAVPAVSAHNGAAISTRDRLTALPYPDPSH